MRRRDFLSAIGGAAAWPLVARAQQPGRTYHIGFVVPVSRYAPAILAFLDELRLRGFIEGQNLVVLPGGFEVSNKQIAEVVADMIRAAPDAILTGGDLITTAFQNATRTLPLIAMTEDLVTAGFAASMARPGGNMTGISLMSADLDGKRQEILMEAVPAAQRIAALADSNVASLKHLQALAATSQTRGREVMMLRVSKPEELRPALDNAKAAGAMAINVLSSPMLFQNRRVIIDRTAALEIPAIYQWPEIAREGGLLAYGPRFVQIFRQRARMTARVLGGANPAELPVEQPTTFELAINLQTAKAIRHQIPTSLILRADEVIE